MREQIAEEATKAHLFPHNHIFTHARFLLHTCVLSMLVFVVFELCSGFFVRRRRSLFQDIHI